MDKVVKFSGPILIDASLRRKLKMGAKWQKSKNPRT